MISSSSSICLFSGYIFTGDISYLTRQKKWKAKNKWLENRYFAVLAKILYIKRLIQKLCPVWMRFWSTIFVSFSTGTLVIFQVILIQSIYTWSSFKIIHKFIYTSNINLFLWLNFHQIIFIFPILKVIFLSLGSISPVIAGKSHLLLRSQCFKHSWVSVVTARLPTVRIRNRPNLSAWREIYVQTHSL